ncbi:unnamed protein product [Cladocopium goreaui]|uniref:Uncharacterized protein n=1 Tax=Cladocopium goreaui TaxID=2562237 RepID=A0A9P1M0S9_9DINO|nr:unnamed protein product [Cladocopium goreaui]
MALVPRRSMSLQELLVLAFLADRHVTIAQDTLYESQELEDQFEGGQAPNISALANSVHWLRQCIFFLQVYESNVDFRDSPQVSTDRCGTFTKSGNVVTFTSSSVKKKTSGAAGESEETKESAISIRFLIQGPEEAPDKLARLEGTSDEVAKMSGGICGDPEPAILTKAR